MFIFFSVFDECDEAISEVANGNREALSVIYRKYGKLIYSVAWQIVKSKSDAEDVLQDVMIKIVRSAHGYRKGTNSKAWVLSIARSSALDKLKKRGNTVALDDFSAEQLFTKDNLEFIYVREALSRLIDEERLIIKLRYYAELDHKAIAKILKITHSAARKRCQRALEKLKAYFEE